MTLGDLKKGDSAHIIGFSGGCPADWKQRLEEMGFFSGSVVELMHEAPFGRDPIVVKVRGTLLALRRKEACVVEVVL